MTGESFTLAPDEQLVTVTAIAARIEALKADAASAPILSSRYEWETAALRGAYQALGGTNPEYLPADR